MNLKREEKIVGMVSLLGFMGIRVPKIIEF